MCYSELHGKQLTQMDDDSQLNFLEKYVLADEADKKSVLNEQSVNGSPIQLFLQGVFNCSSYVQFCFSVFLFYGLGKGVRLTIDKIFQQF